MRQLRERKEAARWSIARREQVSPRETLDSGVVFDSFGDGETAAFKRWLAHSISDYYGLASRSVTLARTASTRVVYVGLEKTLRGQQPPVMPTDIEAVVFSEESCKGRQQAVEPNGRCTLLNSDLRGRVQGAAVPEDVVCDYYSDESCSVPLWIGMEEPGSCRFAEFEIENKAISVLCYDDSRADEI
ncbi:hypothetical protein E4U41_002740 [Claviceps citrina]|nr:hypothetical protein E4U41_002740 [Claviceps citrina]